ncbi:MAG: lipopolysaccharide heptosyltransferase II [Acidobacteriota bacterium]
MTAIDPAGVRRVLIRANNWIGDVVMISPAVRAIRAHFRGARISILAKSWVLEALRGSPDYDDLIEYDRDGAHRGAAGRWRLVAALRRRRFDLAVLFQKAFEAAAFARLAGARVRIGYATDFRRPLLTHPLPLPPARTHHVDVFLGIARALGCPIRDPFPSFHIDDRSRDRAGELLLRSGICSDGPLVAIHPGASKSPRAWHPDRFARLGRRLAKRAGARILLLGGPADRELVGGIAERLPRGRVLVPGADLPLRVVAGLMERCHLFIGSDSGPMHVAAALDVPTIALFGPGIPERTAPRARSAAVLPISRRYPCAPCRQDFFRECPAAPSGKPFCLEEIGVDEVEEAAGELLLSSPPARVCPS